MHVVRRGAGKPLVLVHGLGGNWRSWDPVLEGLAAQREVIAIDLPGFGATPPLDAEVSIATLADAMTSFLEGNDLRDADLVGSSMGARLVLELARRRVGGTVVALDPGGFWSKAHVWIFGASLRASIRLIRLLQPVMPAITGSRIGRTLLLAQLSARPWALPADVVLREMRSYAASPSFDEALTSLIKGPLQEGAPAGSTPGRVVIGWGRKDRVCFPSQADLAMRRFPGAELHWFDGSGHFPHWDRPAETVDLILRSTA